MVRPGICVRTGKKFLHEPKPGIVIFRKDGKRLHTFTAKEGTPEFDAEYWSIMTGKKAEAVRSWGAALKILRTSQEWSDLSARYRQDLDPVFAYLSEKIGGHDVGRLTPADIYRAMDKNAHRVNFANYIPVAISKLAEVAIRQGWLTSNPAVSIKRLKVPKNKTQPHIPWTDEAVTKFRAEAKPLERLIFEIGVGTVQRPGDWVRFTWGDYDGDTISVTQGKTGKRLIIPCTEALRAALDGAKAALPYSPLPSLTILAKQNGKPMTYRRLAEIMYAERKRLNLTAYDLHAMRYRGVMELAWAGCSDDEIMSYSGHSTKDMVIKYAGIARQIMRAMQAREKRK